MKPHALLYLNTTLQVDSAPSGAEVHTLNTERFGIADARGLKDLAYQSGTGGSRCFQITARSLTREAQNALLKLCEDPPPGVSFQLAVPKLNCLIPTLRSRFSLKSTATATTCDLSVAKDFTSLTPADRIALIVAKIKAADSQWQTDLIKGLEVLISAEDQLARTALTRFITYGDASGASKKMLLENLALAI